MYVNMQASTEVKILFLEYDRLNDMVNKHSQQTGTTKGGTNKDDLAQRVTNFANRVLIAQNRYLKGERSYPVDYIKK